MSLFRVWFAVFLTRKSGRGICGSSWFCGCSFWFVLICHRMRPIESMYRLYVSIASFHFRLERHRPNQRKKKLCATFTAWLCAHLIFLFSVSSQHAMECVEQPGESQEALDEKSSNMLSEAQQIASRSITSVKSCRGQHFLLSRWTLEKSAPTG